MRQAINGRLISIGQAWRERFTFKAPLFPVGVSISSQVRATRDSSTVLATITTGNGGITRIDDYTVELYIANTSAFAAGVVVLDMVRTDTSPNENLGFWLTIPVMKPITRLA